MKRNTLISAIILFFLILAAAFTLSAKKQEINPGTLTPALSPALSVSPAVSGKNIVEPPENKTTEQVKIYLIAIDDQGKSDKKIGCGDSVVGVTKKITETDAPLRTALNELLSIKKQYYGESGLYNSLYQSSLTIDQVTITNSIADIRLSGQLLLGGVCDNPRVKAQLENTALQFPTVKSTSIFINNKPLDEVLSEK